MKTKRFKSPDYQAELKAAFPQEKIIAFFPVLLRINKCTTSVLFLSQLLYWNGKGFDKNWIYKTVDESKKETGISKDLQLKAVREWQALGVLEMRLRGIPRRRYFKINFEILLSRLGSSTRTNVNYRSENVDPVGGMSPTNTDSTHDNTSKNTDLQKMREKLIKTMSFR